VSDVTTTGLRELRQNASDFVRQAEEGETIVVTINGREVAELGPVRRNRWRSAVDVASIFSGSADSDWTDDRALIHDRIDDPFSSR